MPTDDHSGQKPTASLLAEAFAALTRLLRGELALARAEVAENLRAVLRGLAYLVIAALLGLVGLNFTATALAAGLVALGLTPLWATVAVAAGFLLFAGGFAQFGLYLMKRAQHGAPRTAQNLRRDVEILKNVVTKDEKS